MDLAKILIHWYHRHKRDLPWRNTNDAYKIWLSEIILQQTRVEQGLPYYEKFIQKFPNVKSLADATEDEVMKLWQGLGYYSRARNLHFAAKQIVQDHDAQFPNTHAEIIQLKGIGDYTAAAIASFAFKEAKPVLDGNVYRFIARYFGVEQAIDLPKTKKHFYEILNSIIDAEQPDTFNQAIMEFGAIQCKPSKPHCAACPLNSSCYALKENKVDVLPLKSKKLQRSVRYFNYLVVNTRDNMLAIQKRTDKDIWKHLYEFPLIETENALEEEQLLQHERIKNEFSSELVLHEKSKEFKHVLSHQDIFAKFWKISDPHFLIRNEGKYLFIKDEELRDFALPRLIELYLEK